MSPDSVDVAIVGCGVSGAAAALAAAQNGAKVSIFEEHSQVGEPSHCSGHVGIGAFRRFSPVLGESMIENEIRGATLHSPSGIQLALQRSQPVTWVLNRAEFDRQLASIAARNGAGLYLSSRVVACTRSAGSLRLKIAGDKAKKEVSCKVLVDAGGCSSSISACGLSRPRGRMLLNSAQITVENLTDVDEDFVELYFGQNYAPGLFGWIIPRRDGSAKLGLAAGGRTNVHQYLEHFISKHPIVSSKLRHAKLLTNPTYHPIPVDGATRCTYADNVLTVGDAASQVKPTTGGGIVFGLACGRIAGQVAARAIRRGETSAKYLSAYERSWRKLIGFDLMTMAWLRRVLYRLPDRHLDRIFGVSADLKTNELLTRTSDIDFQGRTLLSMARDPRLLIPLLSASILSVPSLLRSERGSGAA